MEHIPPIDPDIDDLEVEQGSSVDDCDYADLMSEIIDQEPDYLVMNDGDVILATEFHFSVEGKNRWGFFSATYLTATGLKWFHMLAQQAAITRLLNLGAFSVNYRSIFIVTYQGMMVGPNGREYQAYIINPVKPSKATAKFIDRLDRNGLHREAGELPIFENGKYTTESAKATPESTPEQNAKRTKSTKRAAQPEPEIDGAEQ